MQNLSGRFDLRWIGWPGQSVHDSRTRNELGQTLREEFGCNPVWLSKNQVSAYYQGFSNSSLWPLLHYMPNYMRFQDAWWEEYREVNRRFAEVVLDEARDGDLVWVHDYHLMLLPGLLRRKRPELRIGFFLHTPFPSYEVFRCHPHREDLLQGVLGADLIGFHAFGYLRHFRSAVLRLLALESEMDRIAVGNRHARIGVYPIGIDARRFTDELDSSRHEQLKAQFRTTYHDKQIVLNVERMDYTKGIPRRLDAIDAFLESCPNKDSVVFIFIGVPSRGDVPEYRELRTRIENRVGHINGRHSTLYNTPVRFHHSSVKPEELVALYALADVALVTPLIDGMNLVAKEYVACKRSETGALVLSEFAGAAGELHNAIFVNPYDNAQVAEAIREALAMPEQEKRRRLEPMRIRALEQDAYHWARTFVEKLESLSGRRDAKANATEIVEQLSTRLKEAGRIAWFLDYEGTLREPVSAHHSAEPTPEIRELLARLAADPRSDVFVLSRHAPEKLDAWFGACRCSLVAEHGCMYRLVGGPWHRLNPNADLGWKDRIINVFQLYAGTTPGSTIETRRSSITWTYRHADPEFGRWKANQLAAELSDMLANLPIEIRHGKRRVEVCSMSENKGAALEHFMRISTYDLVVCTGDDITDEPMFRLTQQGLVSIKVGPEETRAGARLANPAELRQVLTRVLDSVPELV
jgi:trehalose 6-phosphate synthase/phosphatase